MNATCEAKLRTANRIPRPWTESHLASRMAPDRWGGSKAQECAGITEKIAGKTRRMGKAQEAQGASGLRVGMKGRRSLERATTARG